MNIIIDAIIAAVANLSKDAVKDCYNALKGAFKKKFGEQSDLVNAVEGLENKPDSPARKAVLQEEVEAAQIEEDSEIIELCRDLLNQLSESSQQQQVINQTISQVKYAATSGTGTARIDNILE